MTIDQFNNTGWTCGMTAEYHGDRKTYAIIAVDFGEQLVGLKGAGSAPEEIYWARCENITLKGGK